MNNIQFATALHILTLLLLEDETLSSSYIAGSIGINPAMVRKSLGLLGSAGLVVTKEGKGGGVTLAKPAGKIRLSEVYAAIKPGPLLGKANNTNPDCHVGKQINQHLDDLCSEADDALVKRLNKISIADFGNRFR